MKVGGLQLFAPEDMPTPDEYRTMILARFADLPAQRFDEEFLIAALLRDLDDFYSKRADVKA